EAIMNGSTPKSSSRKSAVTVSLAWTVEKTMWPVVAAWQAIVAVSWSRISPTMITSGSCRRIDRRLPAKVWPALVLISIWGALAIWYSIGSSLVMIFFWNPSVSGLRGCVVGGFGGAGRPGAEEHAVGLGDQRLDLGDHLGPQADLLEPADLAGVVEDPHDQLLATLGAAGGDAEVDLAGLELGAERAVLWLAL